MKRIFILLLSIISIGLQAQSGFSFQASFKEKDGKPAVSKKIPLRFTIQDQAAKAVYTEDQTATTDQFGLVSLIIGNGSAFSKIDWSKGSFTLKVDCDADNNGTFETLSTGPLLSGPFASNTSLDDSIVGSKYIQVIKKKTNTNQDIVELYLKETVFEEIASRKFLRCDSVFLMDTTPKGIILVFDRIKCDSVRLFDDSKIRDLVKSSFDASKEIIFDELPRRKFIRCDSVFIDTILNGMMTRIFVRIKCDSVRLFDDSKIIDLVKTIIRPINDTVENLKGRIVKIESKPTGIPFPTNPAKGQVLKWNGTEWISDNDLTTVGSGSAATSGPLKGDGSAANPISLQNGTKINEVLRWNGNAWQGIIIQNDNDIDSTNEIQSISLLANNTTIQLSKGGGQIDLPKNIPQWNANSLYNSPVSANTPQNGQVLKWNSTVNKWQPDTDLTSIGTGSVATASPLVGDGSANNPIAIAPVTGTSIPQVLKWINGSWAPAPETAGPQGIQGIQGLQGVKGDKGDKGDQGLQGIQGVQEYRESKAIKVIKDYRVFREYKVPQVLTQLEQEFRLQIV
ncbi:MAG: collagen-like protein [Saprospiraceae bacterium]|nr:collagen-like protein [Saprospiraceae bacterium]